MHIIQVQTIGAWKGAQEHPRKPWSCHLVNSHAFYKEWTDISMKCVAIVNHKRLFIGFSTIEKKLNKCLKNMTPGMVPWYDLTMPWWKFEKVWLMSSCTPFINRTITKEVPCFREGNHQDWRGIQIFFILCPGVFFYDEHTPCKSPCSNLVFFRAHLQYLGDYVHFLGI